MGGMNPFTEQNFYRIRSDTNDPDGGTRTWETTENQTSRLLAAPGDAYTIRFVISNTGAAQETGAETFEGRLGGCDIILVTLSIPNIDMRDPIAFGGHGFLSLKWRITSPATGLVSMVCTRDLDCTVQANSKSEADSHILSRNPFEYRTKSRRRTPGKFVLKQRDTAVC